MFCRWSRRQTLFSPSGFMDVPVVKNGRIDCCNSELPDAGKHPKTEYGNGKTMYDESFRIRGFDDELANAIDAEQQRQEDHVELIASENYASPRVMEAQGSVLTNKYAEGYPGKRYYGGCEFVDQAEELARQRARELFGASYVNVQPHSGSQANAAAYHALLDPGDTLLGMSLNEGGHLTHGSPVNFSGKLFHAVQYGINIETGLIDYDIIADLAENTGRRC